MNMLDKDLNKIWSEIYKPEKYAGSTPQDFFKFEFACLPNKIFQEEEFFSEATKLRGRFDIETPDSLFLRSETQDSNLPIDAVPVFVEKSWEVIRNQKELNLPDQREMVASYRCNELREEASAMIKKDMQAL